MSPRVDLLKPDPGDGKLLPRSFLGNRGCNAPNLAGEDAAP